MAIINQNQPNNQQNGQQPNTNVNNRVYQPQGTGFVNLQSLINNSNASGLGNALGQGVSNTANKTAGNIQQGEQQFQNQYNQANQSLNNQQNQATGVLNKVNTNAQDINPNDISSYQGYLNANYAGPTSIQNQQGLQNQQANAQQNAGLLSSQGGQAELLRSYINQPGYTNANQNLDSVLLGSKPIQNNLQQARQQALQTLSGNNINNLIGLNQTNVSQAQQNLQNQQQGVSNQANTIGTNEQTALQNALTGIQAKDTAATNQYNQLIGGNLSSLNALDVGGNATPAQLNVLNAYKQNGLDYSPFITNTAGQNLTLNGVANANDLGKIECIVSVNW